MRRACRLFRCPLSLFLPLLLAGACRADEFFFKPRDRVVFYGDSITEQRGYTVLIEYYLTTRFPTWDLVFLNAGVSGDTARGGNERLERDVLSERPTAVTVNFGMNDGQYKAPDAAITARYLEQQDELVRRLRAAGIRVALLTTSPVEARRRADGDAYNRTLAAFAVALPAVAARHGAVYVDQFHPCLAVLRKMAADQARFPCFPDGVHTGPLGDLLMAHAILKGLHAPALVADLTLDGAAGKVLAARRCKATDLSLRDGTLTFTRADEALPLAVSVEQRFLLPYLDSLSALNHYGLKVTELSAERYTLAIDGKKVGVFTRQELAGGVKLTRGNLGPIADQSLAVRAQLTELGHLLYYRFKNTRPVAARQLPGSSDEERRLLNERRGELLALIDSMATARRQRIRDAARPRPHEFTLAPVR